MRYTKTSKKFMNAYEWDRELPTKTFVQLGMNKLGQLEDIEAELGVELLTLVSAVQQQKIWIKYENKIDCCDECEYVLLDDFIYFYWNNGEHQVCGIKDYGKTWALTKEELNK